MGDKITISGEVSSKYFKSQPNILTAVKCWLSYCKQYAFEYFIRR